MVTLINCFAVPAGREEVFFEMWKEVNAYMRGKRGYVEHRLHRSLAANAACRFVNVAVWETKADFDAAHDAGFRALASRPEWKEFPARPELYEAVHDGRAEEG